MRRFEAAVLLLSLLIWVTPDSKAHAPSPAPGRTTPVGHTGPQNPTPAPSPTPSPGGPTVGGDEEVERVDTTLVTVPVSVLDRDGRFIADLRQEDFRLYEDGVEQQIAFFAPVEKPFSVVLLIDTSRSTYPRRKEIREAATAFVDQLRPDDNLMVVTFNGEIRVLSEATKDRERLRKAISDISWGGGTFLYGTVDALLNRFFNRLRGRKALVTLTDGQDSDHRVRLLSGDRKGWARITVSPSCQAIPCATYGSNLDDAEESDTLIYPIEYAVPIEHVLINAPDDAHEGIRRTYQLGTTYLRQLAEKTGGRFYSMAGQQNLTQVFGSIANELRYQYSMGYYPKAPAAKRQRRQIKVRVNRPEVAVRARGSYIFDPPKNSPK